MPIWHNISGLTAQDQTQALLGQLNNASYIADKDGENGQNKPVFQKLTK